MENNNYQKLTINISKTSNYHSESSKVQYSETPTNNISSSSYMKSNFHYNKNKEKKKKVKNQELIVNLRYDDEIPSYCKYVTSKKSQRISQSNLDICDQSRFKFILDDTAEVNNFTGKFEWEDVFEVVYSPVETLSCPICIDKNILVPVITRCGHVFCWPCLKSFENYYAKTSPICPFCKEAIELSQVRFCSINTCLQYQEGDNITFNLVMRDKRSFTLYNTAFDPSLEYNFSLTSNFKTSFNHLRLIPDEASEEFSFSRVFFSDKIDKKFEEINKILKETLSEELKHEECLFLYDKRKIDSIQQCIEELEHLKVEREEYRKLKISQKEESKKGSEQQTTSSINIPNQTKSDEKNYIYFFQEKNGDIYFLHPINYSVLLAEYEDEESIPTEITGKILEIEAFQMSPTFKNKYNNLNHLRDGNLFYLVEIDLKPLVSNIVLKQFHTVLKERSKSRLLIKEEEEHYDSLVNKIKEREKEKIDKSDKLLYKQKSEGFTEIDLRKGSVSSLSEYLLEGTDENIVSKKEENSVKKEGNNLKTLFSKKETIKKYSN